MPAVPKMKKTSPKNERATRERSKGPDADEAKAIKKSKGGTYQPKPKAKKNPT